MLFIGFFIFYPSGEKLLNHEQTLPYVEINKNKTEPTEKIFTSSSLAIAPENNLQQNIVNNSYQHIDHLDEFISSDKIYTEQKNVEKLS